MHVHHPNRVNRALAGWPRTGLFVTGWRPTVLSLVLAARPAAAVAFGLEQWVRWGPWLASLVLVVVGLVTQSLVLYAFVVGETRPTA